MVCDTLMNQDADHVHSTTRHLAAGSYQPRPDICTYKRYPLGVSSSILRKWKVLIGYCASCIESNLLIMCCCFPTLRSFFRHVAPSLLGEKGPIRGRPPNQEGQYGLKTFGSSGINPRGQRSKFDTLMHDQATRLTDDEDEDVDVHGLQPDGRFHHVTNIRAGADSQSSDGDVKADYESDGPIVNSKTVTVQFSYRSSTSRE